MKKTLGLVAMVMALMSSCSTVYKSASTSDISMQVHSATVADLKVGDRITYTMSPSKSVRRGGEANVKHVAEAEALSTKGGNADLLIEPSYVITKKRNLFGSKITSITVSGRPAWYTNFRALPDSVLSNPVYRGVAPKKYNRFVSSGHQSVAKQINKNREKFAIEKKRPLVSAQAEIFMGASFMDYTGTSPVIGAAVNVNFNINSTFSVGPGMGFMYDDAGWGVPLYVNARYNFSNRIKKTWFADFRLGGNIAASSDDYDSHSGGVYVGLGAGYCFKHFELALRYNYIGSSVECNDYYYDGTYSNDKNQLNLTLGWRF